ncbi:membrane protein insertion efficiency factor YidD [Helicobacter bizzozeronii]|uniref:membrane protein insertion efficiency factor YidD n=1 Tax=Helicobacter bizzozeronii TaxID=56877 RepID=UPI000CF05E45|nr:membrane protein insertion efficiency factor YidD [Helicobacter bizzozeronii]
MPMRAFCLRLLHLYRYFSAFKPACCRYYPTCSAYALWLMHCESLPKALYKIAKRILSCHPYTAGGIAYPIGSKPIQPMFCAPKEVTLLYFLVPLNPKTPSPYYILKVHSERQ